MEGLSQVFPIFFTGDSLTNIITFQYDKIIQYDFSVTLKEPADAETMERSGKILLDHVMLDIMMPNMDGYEFTKTLHEAENNLPVLMVSAKQLSEDNKKGFLVGTDD